MSKSLKIDKYGPVFKMDYGDGTTYKTIQLKEVKEDVTRDREKIHSKG